MVRLVLVSPSRSCRELDNSKSTYNSPGFGAPSCYGWQTRRYSSCIGGGEALATMKVHHLAPQRLWSQLNTSSRQIVHYHRVGISIGYSFWAVVVERYARPAVRNQYARWGEADYEPLLIAKVISLAGNNTTVSPIMLIPELLMD